ncbi:MAG: hypothetical protein M1825_006262 [Sarcosagium campestre]|nr:MAG: hypothetical protein M1825_006262 [Sarcosagium campestre]
MSRDVPPPYTFQTSQPSGSYFETTYYMPSAMPSAVPSAMPPPGRVMELMDLDQDNDVRMKLEDEDDDEELDLRSGSQISTPTPGTTPTPSRTDGAGPAKRPRGRPRKHPIPSPETKVQKGRSKTGCLTCRRRKKKCDEAKPKCQNCEKNSVVCEGYPERVVWKSGRQRAEEDCDLDHTFLDYYVVQVSNRLTITQGGENPFQRMIIPMALHYKGLMHALLCLSAGHLMAVNGTIGARREHHMSHAIVALQSFAPTYAIIEFDDDIPAWDDETVATSLIMCLETISSGDQVGSYRLHLDLAWEMVVRCSGMQQPYREFLLEFFTYHDIASMLTTLDRRPIHMMENFKLLDFMVQPDAGSFVGVLDGLFGYISKTTRLRDTIRERGSQDDDPLLHHDILSEAVCIDVGLRDWDCRQPEGSQRYLGAQLYRQCAWIYLYRTIHPSKPCEKIRKAVDEGLSLMRQLPPNATTQSILLMPVFLLGCAAFHPEQRPDIRRAFGTMKRYSNLGNIEPSHKVIETLWKLMDEGDLESWDWEQIFVSMNYDFLVT